MSIRTEQIAKLEAELQLHRQTQEAHEAWLKDKNTPVEVSAFGATWFFAREPEWAPSHHYRIAPKPKLRPWKPEEAIGKVVRRKADSGNRLHIICTAEASEVWVAGGSRPYTELLSDFTQLDGSPCGVMEP